MAVNILLTGASGYLGGSLLAEFHKANLAGYDKLFALVRNEEQASGVEKYQAVPLRVDVEDEQAITEAVVSHEISIVYWLIGVWAFNAQGSFIKALSEVRRKTGKEVHFIYTGGAKQFSSHAGHPADRPLLDTDIDLFNTQRTSKTAHDALESSNKTNCKVIEECERLGVRSYLFIPCIVYGKGGGFGNKISIQTVDIVKAAKVCGNVHSIDDDTAVWPVCHISDTASLYLHILRRILHGQEIGHGRQGYFLAAAGSIAWHDLYAAIAVALAKRGVVEDDSVTPAQEKDLEQMARALNVSKDFVQVKLAGTCTLRADHARSIGWRAEYNAEYILAAADEEVEYILCELDGRKA